MENFYWKFDPVEELCCCPNCENEFEITENNYHLTPTDVIIAYIEFCNNHQECPNCKAFLMKDEDFLKKVFPGWNDWDLFVKKLK